MELRLEPGTYALDGAISQLGFAIRHLGISTVRGTFDRISGVLQAGRTLADLSITVEAEVGSVNTGNEKRDYHLLTAEYLDAGAFPTLTFTGAGMIAAGAGHYALAGELEVHGVTRQVQADVIYNGAATFPRVKGHDPAMHYGFSASTTILRSQFGVGYGVPIIGDQVTISLEAQFSEPAAVEFDRKSMDEYDRARRQIAGDIPATQQEIEQAEALLSATKEEVEPYIR